MPKFIKIVRKRFNRICSFIHLGILLSVITSSVGAASTVQSATADTLLLFVGEDIEILSIASRREESARQAPAIATAVSREQFKVSGSVTLSDALSLIPGFYMAPKEWGTMPFLRGIPNSVLFMYDTVPTVSDVSKSINLFDNQISLSAVKRIEVVRGPCSVLWGPDAFAGIVNLTPLSGKDFQGIETGAIYGPQMDKKQGYINLGRDAGAWNAFASVSAQTGNNNDEASNVVRFWGENDRPAPIDQRYGFETPGNSNSLDFYANFSLEDKVSISGKWSKDERSYSISDHKDELRWIESRDSESGFLKLETKKEIDVFSAIRLAGLYTWLHPENRIIDQEKISYRETMKYAELIYDRAVMSGSGLFTGGISYREKDIKNAPVWDDYFPDFLGPDNESFLPRIIYRDYRTELWSVFAQYNQKIGNLSLAAGFRQDIHDEYRDHLSVTAGAVWNPSSYWVFKLLYGTAYRTPFSKQLMADNNPDLEEIQSINAQVVWNPRSEWSLSTTLFINHIENHVMEDPYAGLSEPNKQDIRGIELELRFEPFKALTLSANCTLMDHSGPDETYLYNDFDFIRPDGSVVPHYVELKYPYDSGPETFANVTATWHPVSRLSIFGRIGYFGSKRLLFPRSEALITAPETWLADLNITLKDLFETGWNLSASIKNITDHEYKIPGTYNLIAGRPLRSEIIFEKKW